MVLGKEPVKDYQWDMFRVKSIVYTCIAHTFTFGVQPKIMIFVYRANNRSHDR